MEPVCRNQANFLSYNNNTPCVVKEISRFFNLLRAFLTRLRLKRNEKAEILIRGYGSVAN